MGESRLRRNTPAVPGGTPKWSQPLLRITSTGQFASRNTASVVLPSTAWRNGMRQRSAAAATRWARSASGRQLGSGIGANGLEVKDDRARPEARIGAAVIAEA